MFTSLSNIANVSLGYKSLQNKFFYVNNATIDTYGIEKRFLTPIIRMADIDANSYWQKPDVAVWLFNCIEKKADLRGTGALKYIDAMSNRAAVQKKQTGKSQTIREALESQGGGTWYAPKAKPTKHHIWLRKAIHGTFAPFLFEKATLVDQRCNSIEPLAGMDWELVASAISSSLFAYSLEVNGSASMGAGALEAATSKLRDYPVFDVRTLTAAECNVLVTLGRAVWAENRPLDWSAGGHSGDALRALDDWILRRLSDSPKLEDVYNDIAEVCRSRILVAQDKGKKTRKKRTDNIGSVAESVARSIKPRLELRNFPDDFVGGAKLDIDFNIDTRSLQTMSVSHFFAEDKVTVINKDGTEVIDASFPSPVAEGIRRAVLWGRSAFSVSSDPKVMKAAVKQFLKWMAEIDEEIDAAVRESAVGTGYEYALRRAVYGCLGVSPLSGKKDLPTEINLGSD